MGGPDQPLPADHSTRRVPWGDVASCKLDETEPRQVPLVFSVIILPITFLGATYYPWARLSSIPWLKWTVLVNPLVYMSEGFRASITPEFPHMPLVAIYAGLIGFTVALMWLGFDGFRRRVLA